MSNQLADPDIAAEYNTWLLDDDVLPAPPVLLRQPPVQPRVPSPPGDEEVREGHGPRPRSPAADALAPLPKQARQGTPLPFGSPGSRSFPVALLEGDDDLGDLCRGLRTPPPRVPLPQVEVAAAPEPVRYRGRTLKLTISNQGNLHTQSVHSIAKLIEEKSRATGRYLVTREQHKDGKYHYHAWCQALVGTAGYDLAHMRFGPYHAHDARHADVTKTPAQNDLAWVQYCLKETLPADALLAGQFSHAEASRGELFVCKKLAPIGVYPRFQDCSLSEIIASLKSGVWGALMDAKTPRDALLQCSFVIDPEEGSALKLATQILAAHKALNPQVDSWPVWKINGDTARFEQAELHERVRQMYDLCCKWLADSRAALSDTPGAQRLKVLVIIGPSGIGKTSLARSLAPTGTTYCSGNWTWLAWHTSSLVVVCDDLTPTAGTSTRLQPGAHSEPPPKAWTQTHPTTDRLLHRNNETWPARAVIILANQTPTWLYDAYWKRNTVVVRFADQEGPLWLSPASPEYREWIRAGL